jgi:hypothetical protein
MLVLYSIGSAHTAYIERFAAAPASIHPTGLVLTYEEDPFSFLFHFFVR